MQEQSNQVVDAETFHITKPITQCSYFNIVLYNYDLQAK